MPSPVIGITTSRIQIKNKTYMHASGEKYVESVAAAGGLPLLTPLGLPEEDLQAILARVDGVLFSGGGDIAIHHFDGQPHERVYNVNEDRDRVELALVRDLLETEKPFLGICRGAQVIAVALGGTLYTHIEDQLASALKHDYMPDYPRDKRPHSVKIVPENRLSGIFGGTAFEVNSLHHQGIQHVPPGLLAAAHAPDGLVEAVEIPGPVMRLAAQWHPEWLQAHEPHRSLFQALVKAARG